MKRGERSPRPRMRSRGRPPRAKPRRRPPSPPRPDAVRRASALAAYAVPPPAERPIHLPRQPGPIIGRAAEIADARQWLQRAYVRLLTFTGPAGVGKTRLAVEVAASLVEEFDHGVFLIDLSPLGEPALVLPTMARTLGVREVPGRPLSERLTHVLEDKRLLLVLDNLEHVVPAAPQVAELLAACPGLKFLVTSREVLRVSWEQEFPVPPLGLPDARSLPAPEALARVPAVEFFLARARSVRPDFALTSDSARAVAEICIQLDGLPLAIELAAARIKVLSPQAILSRLQSRLQVLTMGSRDLPARQQTLRAAMDWSYDLLPEAERALLRRLAVFAGGFTLETAGAVCSGEPVNEAQILDHLARLVDKSLVSNPGHRQAARYRLLETVRQYAEDRLRESGEAGSVQGRHLDWYLDLAERAEPELQGPEQRHWLDRLEQEHDNLRAGLGWALERGNAEAALRLAGALWGFWYVRGYWTEGRRWLETVVAASHAGGRALRAKAVNATAVLMWAQGDYGAAAARCEEGIALCREIGDGSGLAFSLNLNALILRHRGDYGRATEILEESLGLRRDLGDRWGVASSLNSLGIIASYRGDYGGATRFFEESLTLRKDLGDRGGIAESLYFLGIVMFHQGDHRRAAGYFEHCLSLFRELGDRSGTASTLHNLGMVAQFLGESDRAARLYGESLSLRADLGDKQGIAECLERLAELARARGEPRRAARLAGAAETVREGRGSGGDPSPPRVVAGGVPGHPDRGAQTKRAAADLAAARAEGRSMSQEQAIEYALAVPASSPALGAGSPKGRAGSTSSPLTLREAEIAALIARGLTNRQIAETLVITEGTAANHVQHILNKLGFDSRAQVAAWAAKQGIEAPSQG